MDATTQYALAYALTTTAGIRGLLALAALSLVAHFGLMQMPQGFVWLGSWQASTALSCVAFLDILGDKIPLLDHALHIAHVIVKPVAAAILVGGVVHPQSNEQLIALMILGALNALGIHAASATARLTSTATTGGFGNPILSLVEDVLSSIMLIVAFVVPYLAVAIALLLTAAIITLAILARKRLAAPRQPGSMSLETRTLRFHWAKSLRT